jgi:hypothetical protein
MTIQQKNNSVSRQIIVKVLIFWGLFLILHFAYDWMQNPIIAVFSGINESFLQHAKIGFISYSIASLIEFFVYGKKTEQPRAFFYSRVFTSMILPWVMFAVYYIAPAFYGRPMPTIPLEIIYANIVLLIIGVILALFELDLEKISFSRFNRIILLILWALCLVEMVLFTFQLPWVDFFREVVL